VVLLSIIVFDGYSAVALRVEAMSSDIGEEDTTPLVPVKDILLSNKDFNNEIY